MVVYKVCKDIITFTASPIGQELISWRTQALEAANGVAALMLAWLP